MAEQGTIQAAVREAMDSKNLSARKLAARINVNKETVLDFVHARRRTHPAIQNLICRELGLDWDLYRKPAFRQAQ